MAESQLHGPSAHHLTENRTSRPDRALAASLASLFFFFSGAYPRQERMEKTTTVQTGFSSSFFMEYRISVMPGSKNRYAGSVDLAMSLPM